MNIFVQTTDTELAFAMKELGYDVECYPENMIYSDLEQRLSHGDIVFWHQVSGHVFYGSKAYVIIISSVLNAEEEYAAAIAGALAYIECNVANKKILNNVIHSVSKGQIWMTRETIAKVFEEYAKSMESRLPC